MWSFEPHVAEAVFRDMLAEAERAGGARRAARPEPAAFARTATRITAIAMESGRVFAGRMFIDATYEGDLMATAGVRYTVGREANAPVRRDAQRRADRAAPSTTSSSSRSIPTSCRATRRAACCRACRPSRPGDDGQGDRRVQAYCFRMCTTDVPENRAPLAQARRTTTRCATSCCCATSRRATCACRGARRACPTARPTRTTTAPSRPTTSA